MAFLSYPHLPNKHAATLILSEKIPLHALLDSPRLFLWKTPTYTIIRTSVNSFSEKYILTLVIVTDLLANLGFND